MFPKGLRAGSVIALLFSAINSSIAEDDVSTLPTVYSEFVPAYTTYPEFSTSAVTVISSDDFSASDITVADVLEQAPSVQIQETGETGSYSSIRVRGAPSQQTQIYIDGVLQPNVAGEGGNLNNLLLSEVERIEVYPGSSPTSLMQGSPGGAVNIVTRQSTDSRAKLTLEAGSFGHYRTAGSGTVTNGNWTASANFDALTVENDFEFENDNGTTLNEDDDYTDTRNNAGYELLNGSVSAAYRNGNNLYSGTFSALQSKKEIPDSSNSDIEEAYYEEEDLRGLLSANFNQWTDGVDSSIRLQLQKNEGHFYDPDSSIGWSANDSKDVLVSSQLQQSSSASFSSGLITLSNSLQFDSFELEDTLDYATVDVERSQIATSLAAEWFVSDEITASGSVRHLATDETTHTSDSENDDSLLGGQVGIRFDHQRMSVQWSAQYSYRIANLIERFGNTGSFSGNDDLENETALSTELSLGYQWKKLKLNTAVYARESENTIVPFYSTSGIGQYVNLSGATFYGVEWQAEYDWKNIHFISSGSLQDGITHSNLEVYDGKQVPGFYPVSLTQSLGWKFSNAWLIQGEYTYEDGLYYDRANSTLAPTKNVVNAELKWRNQTWQASLALENIFDSDYLDFSRMVVPGRSVTLTIEYLIGVKQ